MTGFHGGFFWFRVFVQLDSLICSGSIINEIRKRTKADVRISKGEKPKWADSTDELVEVVGEVSRVRDALIQIVLRLRDDVLKDREGGHNTSAGADSMYSGDGRQWLWIFVFILVKDVWKACQYPWNPQGHTTVSTFQRLVNTLGTPKDTPQLREKLLKLFLSNSLVILLKFGGVVLFPEATLPLRVIKPNFIAAIERALCQVDTPYTIGVVHRDPDNGRMRFATVGTTAETQEHCFMLLSIVKTQEHSFTLYEMEHTFTLGSMFG
ncbi:KH domain-containing protein [Camellia lanceoleosa]|uniref:KH domain-containing protein n=1 Tax=Camellia lanceoleosa TaxID=1840588 RepID=A0ACC0HCG1_9ERIC|nr:KH domain-containing protein [Camellia lanceoleosa]